MSLTTEPSLAAIILDPIICDALRRGFTAANTFYVLVQHVQAKCDSSTLDSGLNESYVQILEDWNKLEIS